MRDACVSEWQKAKTNVGEWKNWVRKVEGRYSVCQIYLCGREAESILIFGWWQKKVQYKFNKQKKLQSSFCSPAPPEITIVFRLKFYSNLRHNFHWSSWRAWHSVWLKERNFISTMYGVQGMLVIFLCRKVCYHLGKVPVPWCPLEF